MATPEDISVTIKCNNGQKYQANVNTGATVLEFKQQLADVTSIPVEQQRLIFAGRVLKDSQPLTDYSMQ
jgi:ubiquilin